MGETGARLLLGLSDGRTSASGAGTPLKYLLANWKMYPTVGEALALLGTVQEGLKDRARRGGALPLPIVCPPCVSLVPMRALVDQQLVRLGAQNCHWEQEGPYTGEVSPRMLNGLVEYVLVGHSERRAAGETDEQISKKVSAVTEAGLTPILFVGEDEPDDEARSQTEHRLRLGLSRADLENHPALVVYEPAWAIGAEHPADAEYVGGMVEHLKGWLRELGVTDPEVIYGGTVNDENIEQFAELDLLDGVGATRGSLDAEEFLAMVDRLS